MANSLPRDLELIAEIEQQIREIDHKTAMLILHRQRPNYTRAELCTNYQAGLLTSNEVERIKLAQSRQFVHA